MGFCGIYQQIVFFFPEKKLMDLQFNRKEVYPENFVFVA